jgi:ABC-type antimicrobial peptide transport system permease subunit
VRARRRRALLTGLGIALAAAMLVAALVVSDSLGFGFERATKAADLPDIIVRFNPQGSSRVAGRIAALPDVAAYTLRQEVTNVGLQTADESAGNGDVEVVGPGRRGYAIVAGRDLSSRPGEVVVEKGLADAWGLKVGGTLEIDGLGPQRIVGESESPDNVSYPLAVPRVYVSAAAVHVSPGANVNLAEIWLRDPSNLNEVLVQARATSYGLHGVRFVTRSGVRVLLDQAAGIVIDLLVALSVIALATAGVMLAASARAEVQRRLRSIGVRRAVGASRGHLALGQGLEALLVAAPAATLGAVGGVLATYGPTTRLLVLLNEPAPGIALGPALIAAWLAAIAIPVLAAAWPAWRVAGRPPVGLLRGAELARRGGGGRWRGRGPWRGRGERRGRGPWRGRGEGRARGPWRGGGEGRGGRARSLAVRRAGLTTLGARLAAAGRTRLVATAATLGFSTAFVLLMLALASALSTLETDPGALGKRYQLTADLPASAAAHVRSIPGVQAAAARYETEAVDSFSLGETIDVIAYPGDHTVFEAPPLVSGTRLRGTHQAEVGLGLAQALGVTPGATLAIQLDSGAELRLRVAGVVSSLVEDGRVAYVPAAALLAADPSASDEEQLAVRLKPGANAAAVSAALGPSTASASTAVGRGVPLVAVLRSILRAVAIVDGLVCLYALIQACALTVQERRRTVSVLRAFGAGGPAVRRLLTGAVIALVAPAAAVGIVLERLVLGPALGRLAASYVTLSLGASVLEIAVVLAGLALAGAVAVVWVARQATRESVIAGLRAS